MSSSHGNSYDNDNNSESNYNQTPATPEPNTNINDETNNFETYHNNNDSQETEINTNLEASTNLQNAAIRVQNQNGQQQYILVCDSNGQQKIETVNAEELARIQLQQQQQQQIQQQQQNQPQNHGSSNHGSNSDHNQNSGQNSNDDDNSGSHPATHIQIGSNPATRTIQIHQAPNQNFQQQNQGQTLAYHTTSNGQPMIIHQQGNNQGQQIQMAQIQTGPQGQQQIVMLPSYLLQGVGIQTINVQGNGSHTYIIQQQPLPENSRIIEQNGQTYIATTQGPLEVHGKRIKQEIDYQPQITRKVQPSSVGQVMYTTNGNFESLPTQLNGQYPMHKVQHNEQNLPTIVRNDTQVYQYVQTNQPQPIPLNKPKPRHASRSVNKIKEYQNLPANLTGKEKLDKNEFLVTDLNTNEKVHACDIGTCDATFKRFEDLARHRRMHSADRPYACDYPGCDFTSKRKDNLQSHKKTHETKKHFCQFVDCQRKERGFTRRDELKRHYESHIRKLNKKIHNSSNDSEKIMKLINDLNQIIETSLLSDKNKGNSHSASMIYGQGGQSSSNAVGRPRKSPKLTKKQLAQQQQQQLQNAVQRGQTMTIVNSQGQQQQILIQSSPHHNNLPTLQPQQSHFNTHQVSIKEENEDHLEQSAVEGLLCLKYSNDKKSQQQQQNHQNQNHQNPNPQNHAIQHNQNPGMNIQMHRDGVPIQIQPQQQQPQQPPVQNQNNYPRQRQVIVTDSNGNRHAIITQSVDDDNTYEQQIQQSNVRNQQIQQQIQQQILNQTSGNSVSNGNPNLTNPQNSSSPNTNMSNHGGNSNQQQNNISPHQLNHMQQQQIIQGPNGETFAVTRSGGTTNLLQDQNGNITCKIENVENLNAHEKNMLHNAVKNAMHQNQHQNQPNTHSDEIESPTNEVAQPIPLLPTENKNSSSHHINESNDSILDTSKNGTVLGIQTEAGYIDLRTDFDENPNSEIAELCELPANSETELELNNNQADYLAETIEFLKEKDRKRAREEEELVTQPKSPKRLKSTDNTETDLNDYNGLDPAEIAIEKAIANATSGNLLYGNIENP